MRQAEDLKVKYEFANKRTEEAVKHRRRKHGSPSTSKRGAWKSLLDEEKDRRVAAEAACAAHNTAMMVPAQALQISG